MVEAPKFEFVFAAGPEAGLAGASDVVFGIADLPVFPKRLGVGAAAVEVGAEMPVNAAAVVAALSWGFPRLGKKLVDCAPVEACGGSEVVGLLKKLKPPDVAAVDSSDFDVVD